MGGHEKNSNIENGYIVDKVAQAPRNNERSHTIDFVKGFLIILVAVGHVIPGTLQESLARWLIYSFHMPLFMGVSGYLVNGGKLDVLSWKEFVVKYLRRIIIPWLLAVLIFYIATVSGSYSTMSLAKAFIKPYYHLWFAVAYCVYLLVAKVIANHAGGGYCILIISSIITIIFRLIEFDGDGALLQLLGVIQYTLRPQMFVFFYLGYVVRNYLLYPKQLHFVKKDNSNNGYAVPVFLLVYAAIEVFLYFNYNSVVDAGIYLVMNICLVTIITRLFSSGIEIRNSAIEFIGRNSLPIYLWHVAAILIIKQVIGTDQMFVYYLVNAIAFIAEVLAVWAFNNIPFVRKYIFGNLK